MTVVKSWQDFAAGCFFLAIGLLVLYGLKDVRMGTAMRMGPGFIPALLGWGLAICGGAICIRALIKAGAGLEALALKPLLLVCGGTAVFGLLMPRVGLFISSMAITLVVSFASKKMSIMESLLLSVILAGAACALFGGLLGLPMRLWPGE